MKITAKYTTTMYKTIEVDDKFKVLLDSHFCDSNWEEADELIEELPTVMADTLGISLFDILGGFDPETNEILFEG